MVWLERLARDAGDLALTHFGSAETSLKADQSLVTQADLAVEAFVRKELETTRPGESVLGEEGGGPPPESDVVWAVDPVDGTRAFAHGLPVWGVSIGAIVEGHPTVGVFVQPVTGDLYATDGRAATCNGRPMGPPDPSLDGNSVLLVSEGAFQRLYPGYPGKVLSLGSAAAHLCYAAKGAAIGAVDKASIWDYAAGAAILGVVGIQLRYLSGEPVDFCALMDGEPVTQSTLACPDHRFEVLQRALVGP